MHRTNVGTDGDTWRTLIRLGLPALFCLFTLTTTTGAFADVQADIQSILSGSSYQKELPLKPAPQNQPDETETIELPDIPDDFSSIPDQSPSSAGPVLKSLLWVLAIVGGILLLLYIFSAIQRLPRRTKAPQAKKAQKTSNDPEETTVAKVTPFDEVERLAREGAFGEAVHLLLLHSLEELRRRSPYGRDPALTSREILTEAALAKDARASLAFIVSAVEVGHFGGQAINKAIYERCLESYRTFAAASTT